MLEWVSSEWKNINRDWASLFITHTFIHWGAWVRGEVAGTRERLLLWGDHLYVFGFYFWCWFYLWGSYGVFSFMVFLRKFLCVSCILCFIAVHVIFSVKDPKIIMLSYSGIRVVICIIIYWYPKDRENSQEMNFWSFHERVLVSHKYLK